MTAVTRLEKTWMPQDITDVYGHEWNVVLQNVESLLLYSPSTGIYLPDRCNIVNQGSNLSDDMS